jgi:ATP-dependent RNA helicase DeaD
MKKFSDLNVDSEIVKALDDIGFTEMTDIQLKVIPPALEGKDIIAQAMTGSGKTAAFGVPLSQNIEKGKGVQAVVINPTRELVVQVSSEMEKFSRRKRLSVVSIFGGVSMEPQYKKLKNSEIVVGTPGRMLDHMQRGTLKLGKVKYLVLDEADRMFDMGFIDDIKKIISQIPKSRQTMLFSATIPDEIKRIARQFMKEPIKIATEEHVSKHLLKHYYYDTKQEEKLSLLGFLIKKEKPKLAIVFCATRGITDFVARTLYEMGIDARAIHGGMTQDRRLKVLESFHKGTTHVLVATDVAARGLDIRDVSHIFNYDLPKTVEDFTHRIGRTARFGKEGESISLLSREDHRTFEKILRRIEVNKLKVPSDFVPRRIFFRRSFSAKGSEFRRGPKPGSKRPGFKRHRNSARRLR